MWELFSEFSAQSFCKPKTAKKKKKKYSLIVKKTKNKKESSTCPCSKTPFLFCLNRHWLASYYQSQGASFHLPSIQSVQRPETKKTYLNSKPGGNNWQGLGSNRSLGITPSSPRPHRAQEAQVCTAHSNMAATNHMRLLSTRCASRDMLSAHFTCLSKSQCTKISLIFITILH